MLQALFPHLDYRRSDSVPHGRLFLPAPTMHMDTHRNHVPAGEALLPSESPLETGAGFYGWHSYLFGELAEWGDQRLAQSQPPLRDLGIRCASLRTPEPAPRRRPRSQAQIHQQPQAKHRERQRTLIQPVVPPLPSCLRCRQAVRARYSTWVSARTSSKWRIAALTRARDFIDPSRSPGSLSTSCKRA